MTEPEKPGPEKPGSDGTEGWSWGQPPAQDQGSYVPPMPPPGGGFSEPTAQYGQQPSYPPPNYGQQPPQPSYGTPAPTAQYGGMPPKPETGLALAIVSTLCCNLLGIVAIAKAAQVEHLWSAGLYQPALDAAAQARKWAKYAFITGGCVWGLIILFYVAVFAAALSSIGSSTS